MRSRFILLTLAVLSVVARGRDTKIVHDFESEEELKLWDFAKKSASIVSEHATHGQKCVKIASTEHMFWFRVQKDWSAYDTLEVDVFVEGDEPVSGHLLIGDELWKSTKGGTYWNRHN